jgi:hypothetical protein
VCALYSVRYPTISGLCGSSRSGAELLFDSDWACVVIPLLSRYCDKWKAEHIHVKRELNGRKSLYLFSVLALQDGPFAVGPLGMGPLGMGPLGMGPFVAGFLF